MKTLNNTERNFASVSPSANALLLLKGNTDIPFARQAAELIMKPEKYKAGYAQQSLGDCLRIMHLEARYMSIDQLLKGLPVKNILELSSGFSFRGLDMVQQGDIHYIDTDLPGIIEEKKKLVEAMQDRQSTVAGKLELVPLNALDEDAFAETANRFEPGAIAIVNEGLLMYLNMEEKKQLSATIHRVLSERGGCWITADIYTKVPGLSSIVKMDDELEHFFEQHHIHENKFEDIEAAERFFKHCGFIIEQEATIDYGKLKAVPFIREKATKEQLEEVSKVGKINATWRLRVA
jgi:O-methyltransferase involved in polyketide biosynthesis